MKSPINRSNYSRVEPSTASSSPVAKRSSRSPAAEPKSHQAIEEMINSKYSRLEKQIANLRATCPQLVEGYPSSRSAVAAGADQKSQAQSSCRAARARSCSPMKNEIQQSASERNTSGSRSVPEANRMVASKIAQKANDCSA